ncbi:hypothetical protein WR25_15654 [Diploscapter pachys]|uniref:GST C-terminal domain-containing protein n=1 Tax=Diploscapter pachys TaxID=2018661 RepID=A0A2A2JCS0_9BILA|nr:hypothetical protein WR25_15654 [Diploscapter pachys]
MPQIRETNYKKDTVYLYQFNRNSTVPTLSPFSLKTETWLRSHGIPYENRFVTSDRSSNGYLPFIELNGQIIEDSELIILKLSEYFKIEFLFRMKAVFGHFSADNFKVLLKKDLDALNDFLGSNDYFGGDRMNLTDCSVFGMLASTFYLPYWNVATEMLNDDYPNLVKFMEKIRKEIWINDFTKSQ